MNALRLRTVAVLCLLTLPWTASAVELRFEQGSLIIPMQKAYQDDCGVVSAYGLVYRLLQQNVTIYWGVNPAKASHHRCKNKANPTNATPPVPTSDALFVDGCDVTVSKDSGKPVSLLDASGNFVEDWSTYSSLDVPNNMGEAAFKVNKDRKFLRYMGGPFIIDATDAPRALALLKDPSLATYFSKFRTPANCASKGMGGAFFVNIHRANNEFVAPIARIINEVPPPIALVRGVNSSGVGSVEILVAYLQNAGLKSTAVPDPNEGTFEKHGLIYDVLDQDKDLISTPTYPKGKLNAPDPLAPTKSFYKVMWAPHWDGIKDEYKGASSPPPGQDKVNTKPDPKVLESGLNNIAAFVDSGNSIFNECASIATYENAWNPATPPGGSAGSESKYYNFDPTDSLEYITKGVTTGNEATRFFTGANKAAGKPWGLLKAGNSQFYGGTDSTKPSKFVPDGRDCSDLPGNTTQECYVFKNASDLFTQKGDYPLTVQWGGVEAFKPRVGTKYPDDTTVLFSTYSPTASKSGWDMFMHRQKDNNRFKGKVIYLAGHRYDLSAAGTRIVLNTLLNLAFKPNGQELSRSEPVGDLYKPVPGSPEQKWRVLSGTFLDTPPQPLYPERESFQADKAADWVYPYIEGRFRSIPLDTIDDTARQDFSKSFTWEASKRMLPPKDRQIFTVLGNNQDGLTRVNFELAQLQGSCLDRQTTPATGKIEKVCDLQEALAIDRVSANLTPLDPDGNGKVEYTLTLTPTKVNDDNHWSLHFVQRVRGNCVAHSLLENLLPTEANCDNKQFGEVRSTLGGLDHGSAAVVGPSLYIPATRPKVAYVGGLDGQLHAIYLEGTVGSVLGKPRPSVQEGEELWSFIPKGQLSRLAYNFGRVDLSPVVSDVYVDYDTSSTTINAGVLDPKNRSTGTFKWRTVLVSGSGRLGGELFALDVTDPLNPFILWDVTAESDFANSKILAENNVPLWRECTPETGKTTCGPLSYLAQPTFNDKDDPTQSNLTAPYNYSTLGEAVSLNLVPLRRGNRPSFQVVVATNGITGAQQLQVFAIDVGTGKKLWQWQRRYKSTTSNSVPAGTSTIDTDGDGSMERVFAGDAEGNVWELNAYTGANINTFKVSDSEYKNVPVFKVSGTEEEMKLHPISTVPAIMRLPSVLDGKFKTLVNGSNGKLALVFGTGGMDWVLGLNPLAQGRLYVVPTLYEDLNVRRKLTTDVSKIDTSKPTEVDLPKYGNSMTLTPSVTLSPKERVEGAPKIVGSQILLSTAMGKTAGDYAADNAGKLHMLNLNNASTSEQDKSIDMGKSAAGVAVVDGYVVNQTFRGIQKTKEKIDVPVAGLPGKRTPARVGSWLDTGRALSE